MVCTFITIKNSQRIQETKEQVHSATNAAPRKTWLLWRRISGRCQATKNKRLERTNPNQQRYAFLTVAKQQNQI